MFQTNIYYFMNVKEYIVSIQEIYGVLSLSMEPLDAKYAVVGCIYMETLGCMYVPFGCISDSG